MSMIGSKVHPMALCDISDNISVVNDRERRQEWDNDNDWWWQRQQRLQWWGEGRKQRDDGRFQYPLPQYSLWMSSRSVLPSMCTVIIEAGATGCYFQQKIDEGEEWWQGKRRTTVGIMMMTKKTTTTNHNHDDYEEGYDSDYTVNQY